MFTHYHQMNAVLSWNSMEQPDIELSILLAKSTGELTSLRSSITIPADTNSFNIELSGQEMAIAWNLLASMPNLFETIKRHLGGEFVVHEAYHFVASNYNQKSKVNTSGFWHRDSVGRRIRCSSV